MEAAAAVEPFSIRGYAERMRAVGGPAKCWPFGGGGEEEEAPRLPPMAVPRFRWWGHELAAARGEGEVVVNGVEGVGGGGGSKGGALEERRKRSRGNGGLERAKKRRRLLLVRIVLKHKEKAHKQQSTSPLLIAHLLQRKLGSRLLRKSINSTAHTQRKLAVTKRLPMTHCLSLYQNNSFTMRNQNRIGTGHPASSVLRESKAKSFVKQPTTKLNKLALSLSKPCSEVVKHVTCPVKDDIFGDLPLLESSKVMFSTAGDQLPTAIEEPFLAEQSGADVMPETALSNSTADKELICLSESKQQSYLCSHPSSAGLRSPVNGSSIDMMKHCFVASVDLNHVIQKSHYMSPEDIASPLLQLKSIDVPALSSYSEKGSKSGFTSPAQECSPMTTDCSKEISTPCISSSAMSTEALKTSKEAITEEKETSVEVEKSTATKVSDPVVPTKSHFSAKDSISSFGRSHMTGNARPGDNSMPSHKAFSAFHPNSQDKFVKTNSYGIDDVKHVWPVRHHCIAKDSACSFTASGPLSNSGSRLKSLLPDSSFLTGDQCAQYLKLHPVSTPANFGLAFMKLPGLERMEISRCNGRANGDKSVNCRGSISMTSTCQQEQANIITNKRQDPARIVSQKSEAAQTSLYGYVREEARHPHEPTMRLMGKTVTVCKRSKEHVGLTDREVWTDKKIITEGGHPTSISGQLPQKILIACQDPVTSTGQGMESSEFSSRISSSSLPETRLNSGNLHSQRLPPMSCISSSVQNYSLNTGSQFLFQAEVNEASKILSPEAHQLAPVATFSHSRISPLNTSASCMHTENQNFLDPAANQSSPCFPRWVLHTTMQEKYQTSAFLSYDDPSSVPIRQPCPVPGTKNISTSIVSFADGSFNSAQPRNSFSILQSSPILTNLASKSMSAVTPTCMCNNANMDSMRCELIRGADCASECHRRLAGMDDVSPRPAKKPHVTQQKAFEAQVSSDVRNHLYGWTLNDAVGPQMLNFSTGKGEVGTHITTGEKKGLKVNTASIQVTSTI